jgi:hypothetical protein
MKKNLLLVVLIIILLAVTTQAQNFINLATMGGTSILGVANGGLGASGAPYSLNLVTTGLLDGRANVVRPSGGTYNFSDGYSNTIAFNENASASAAFTGTLPTAAIGLTKCISNSDSGGVADTGAITITTSAAGQFIHYNGHLGASGGSAVSVGAAGDKACLIGKSSTDWELYAQSGSWNNP